VKTIEDLGQIAHEAWRDHWWDETKGTGQRSQQGAFINVAKAIVAAMLEDGVSWAPGDDD
jgi:hypothetical protein